MPCLAPLRNGYYTQRRFFRSVPMAKFPRKGVIAAVATAVVIAVAAGTALYFGLGDSSAAAKTSAF